MTYWDPPVGARSWQNPSSLPRIHMVEVLKHFISNGCLSLWHIIPFAILKGYLESCHLCEIWESTGVGNGTLRPIDDLWMLSITSFICLLHLKKVLKHFISNGCLSFQYIILFLYWEGTENLAFCVHFESEKPWHMPYWDPPVGARSWQNPSSLPRIHMVEVLKHFISNICLSLWHIIPFAILRGYLESCHLCEIWESTGVGNGTLRPIDDLWMLSKFLSSVSCI